MDDKEKQRLINLGYTIEEIDYMEECSWLEETYWEMSRELEASNKSVK